MWFIVSKKRHRKVLDEWGKQEHELTEKINRLAVIVTEQEGNIATKDTILKSTEREEVLFDLQSALNLIRDYQRAYSMMSMADPKISQANALLRKYGIEIEENATYLGFQRTADFHEPNVGGDTAIDFTTIAPQEQPKTRWEREEEKWGAEAYGLGTVRIDAEAIDEGEDKEEGYTRARITYHDCSDDAPSE